MIKLAEDRFSILKQDNQIAMMFELLYMYLFIIAIKTFEIGSMSLRILYKFRLHVLLFSCYFDINYMYDKDKMLKFMRKKNRKTIADNMIHGICL